MAFTSLEDKIAHFGDPVTMLRTAPHGHYVFPFQAQYTNWRDEQDAWGQTAVLFDQSFHMDDMYFEGPDVKRFFSEVCVNDFTTFGRNKAKQVAAVTPEGNHIGDGILFGFEDDRWSVVAAPYINNWLQYHLEIGDYDVEVSLDPRSEANPGHRKVFRLQVQGPRALEAIQRAAGGSMPDIKFFTMGEFTIAGVPVRALNHTMAGVPGHEHTGLEIIGDFEHHDVVAAAIVAAGQEFGLRQGGSIAYPSTCLESGWVAMPVSAVYSADSMKAYREHLGADTLEAHASLGGSFYSDDITDHYYSPYDLGLGRVVKFDHDFIGRDALLAKAKEPHLKKVRLEWSDDDALSVIGASLFGTDDATRAKYLDMPLSVYTTFKVDKVLHGDATVGRSEYTGYLSTARKFVSIGLVDEQFAVHGGELTVVWGNHDDSNPVVEGHAPREVRVTVNANAYS